MGTQDVKANLTTEQRSAFMRALLNDVRAMEKMLDEGTFESGVCRIGAEQELVMVDKRWNPAPIAMELLEKLDDDRFTTEIARFNIEGNLPPLTFTGDCLSRLEAELRDLVQVARAGSQAYDCDIALTGILPTLSKSDLGRENIADRPRYFALDEALSSLRGGPYELNIKGVDEVFFEHDTVLLEALNTSFQLHYQVEAPQFASMYNLAQAIAAPTLAVATNSPVLFGKRLWRETRIAIFQQTVDTRLGTPHQRDVIARVRFGEAWVEDSVLEIFKNDISRFRVILATDIEEEPFEALEQGRAPKLQALQLFNSTVYRWNRACYGISEGKPHLRIENRLFPAGPTIIDEVANAALWFGLMHGGADAWGDIKTKMSFDDVSSNFVASARQGMSAELHWLDGRHVAVRDLVMHEMIPVAKSGLQRAGVDNDDIERLMDVIMRRVETRRTGSQWLLESAKSMQNRGSRSERLAALTAATVSRQHAEPEHPVHDWSLARLEEAGGWEMNFQRVEQYMATELFTVQADDTIDLVVTLMDWEAIRHIPVEDDKNMLIGVVSYRPLLKHLAKCLTARNREELQSVTVGSIMKTNPVSVTPETSTLEAIAMMREHQISCLPVTTDGRLVGIITEHDFMPIASQLIEEQLRRASGSDETI